MPTSRRTTWICESQDATVLDAEILHLGSAIVNGNDSTSMLPIVQGHVLRVKLTQAPCAVAPDDVALDIVHSEI